MAPVKKQKANKSSKKEKVEKEVKPADESVISGQLQKKINKKQQKPKKDPRGVVFIKHLPHGFFEEQLKKYFEQFGNVTRVRLARSRRTGNSKGYAFVEFEYPEVAEVAAETMDNYLMFKRIVKAAYIPPEKQQFNYFRTNVKQIKNKSGKTVWVSGKTASIQQKAKEHNDWSEEKYQARTVKQLKKVKKMAEKYAHLGIDINSIVVPPKVITEEEQKPKNKSKSQKTKEGIAAVGSKAPKRKAANEDKTSSSKKKPSKKNLGLEDLLGNTIQEDSEDDDYIAMPESAEEEEENEESSDEETYGFTNDSDNDDEEKNSDESEEEDENEINVPIVNLKKTKKTPFGKSLKASSGERFDQMLKRKPHTGGIQKLNKKSTKQTKKSKAALQLAAAKELAKPLNKVKGKLGKSTKPGKLTKKVK